MTDTKRQSKKSPQSPNQMIHSNPPPPPPRRESSSRGREMSRSASNGRREGGGGAGRSVADSNSRPKATSSDDNGVRSKSRPRDKCGSRSKSKTRQSSKPPGTSKKKQQSKKSQDDSKSRSKKNVTRSSSKKRPSAKKRESFDQNAKKAIPASIRMISGCRDSQTSADVSKISSQFQLPNPAGRSGGACTAALLEVLYQSYERETDDVSWVKVLRQMRDVLEGRGFEQVPQLTSSRMIDVHDPFAITPTGGSFRHKSNTKRALLIGINYTGQKGQLSGCHNDVHNVAKYLMEEEGFRKENVTILMDDGKHKTPTKINILTAYKRLVRECREGDVVFCHYSGHGGRLADDDDDEEDGYDETLIPVDFNKAGQIRDDELLKILVHPMPAGVNMTCLMDCCHSGTVLDLPYRFTADGESEEMEINDRVNFEDALWSGVGLALGVAAGAAAANAVANALAPEPAMMILGGGPNAIHEYSDSDCCVIL